MEKLVCSKCKRMYERSRILVLSDAIISRGFCGICNIRNLARVWIAGVAHERRVHLLRRIVQQYRVLGMNSDSARRSIRQLFSDTCVILL